MAGSEKDNNPKAKVNFDDPTLRQSACPACGHLLAVDIFISEQPLSTLAWPETEDEAKGLTQLPLEFVQCLRCTHVYNAAFDPDAVPYVSKPNNMYNNGGIWQQFIGSTNSKLIDILPHEPTVVEIGHGDGTFLSQFSKQFEGGDFIGFDPNGSAQSDDTVRFEKSLFSPFTDLPQYRPDLIISRHVLEHMLSPLGFLQSVAIAGSQFEIWPLIYIEVPCVDRMLRFGRINDLYYEHCSQFTTQSFSEMLRRAGVDIIEIGHGYDWEVLYCVVHPRAQLGQLKVVDRSTTFRKRVFESINSIRSQLFDLISEDRKVAIWGGTGKSAAFINHHRLTADFFPTVVDSDARKVGTFVPGAGQVIRDKLWLKENPVNYIVVPPQWRAQDILNEIRANDIPFEHLFIEHDGHLIDFEYGDHPYGGAKPKRQD